MRIWDVDPAELCRSHLLGEHRELHGLWNILTRDLAGYRTHPETRRWVGRLAALYRRHEALVSEMQRRGYGHHSPLDPELATGQAHQDTFVDPPAEQRRILAAKPCDCLLPAPGSPTARADSTPGADRPVRPDPPVTAPDARPPLTPGFHDRVLPDGGARWVLYVPHAYDPDRAWPLIVFLHGRGEEGSDGRLQTSVGLGPALRAHPQRWPAIVVFPQKPRDRHGWTEYEPRILATLAAARAEARVDPDRITLTGVSLGGFGAWMLAPRHRDLFAAIAPVCGGGDPADAPDLATLPIWAFHGTADPVVPVEHTTRMIDAVRSAGGDPRLTLYDGVGHDSWTRAYDEADLPAWLLAARLP